MKIPRKSFIVAILFISLASFAQEERIKLNLEEGKTYVFESKSTRTEFDIFDNPTITSKSKSEIHVEIEQFDGKNMVFTSKTVSGMSENPDSKVKSLTNWKFPPVVNDVNESFNPITTTNGILPMTGFRYKLNLDDNTIEFLNKSVVLDSARKIMQERGFNEEFIVKGIDFFKEENAIWDRNHEAVQFIVYFNNSIQTKNALKSPFLNESFNQNENGAYIRGNETAQPGTTFSKVELSKKNGFPAYYFEAKHDSISERYRREKYSRLIEKEITFEKEFRTEKDLFTFECTMENPKDSVITLFYLDNPYDFNYTKQVLKLDENNQVSFQTKLQAPSLIFFVNKPIKYSIDFSSTFFYAEPHDTLILYFTSGFNQAPLEILGTNAAINQLLRDIPNVHQLFFPLSVHRADNPEVFTKAQNVVEKFNKFVKERNYKVEDDVFQFLRNELIAIEYFHYFAFLNRYHSNSISLSNASKSTKEFNEENEILKIAEEKIRDFDIHDYYNDYGIFSRKLSMQYFNYYLKNVSRIQNPQFNNVRHSIQEEFELGKMILGSSIFYRIMADRITSSITKSMHSSYVRPATYELDNAISLIDDLIRQSYSEHFKNHLKTFRDTRLKWENENYIPETTFYKPDGSTVKLDEMLKGKPTVLYINLRGDTYRYDFDRETENNPNIRYVMIMEGSNLEKWQDYVERAEPVAEQLLLLNNEQSLDDIFLRNKSLYIVYDKNGKLVEYDVEKHRTTKLAKQSLEQKKELDKSQLQTIVVILLMLLILFTIGLIIWKWRVRQRFRKEEQQRRLRELELTAIRSQMNPHFLFNSLNSVQNLVQQNKGREAHLYLSDFAGLIRKVLQNSEKEEVSLAEELEMVQQYLNLEKLRFNFDYSITVDDKIEKYSTVVPSNILQPIVENAIVHGLKHKSDNRVVKINVQPDNRGLKIIVEDNGIGRVAAAELSKTKNGKGLKMVEERLNVLQQKQGERYQIEITDFMEDKTGTRVEILIPDD